MQSVVIDSVTYVQYVLKINSSVDVLLGNTTKKLQTTQSTSIRQKMLKTPRVKSHPENTVSVQPQIVNIDTCVKS